MGKFSKKTARRTLDTLWSKVIHKRDKRCQWCGEKEKKLEAHHIVTKARAGYAGRWEIDNGVLLCFYCHKNKIPNQSVEYGDWIRGWLHDHDLDYDQLKMTFEGAIFKLNKQNYEVKKKVLQGILEELENGF